MAGVETASARPDSARPTLALLVSARAMSFGVNPSTSNTAFSPGRRCLHPAPTFASARQHRSGSEKTAPKHFPREVQSVGRQRQPSTQTVWPIELLRVLRATNLSPVLATRLKHPHSAAAPPQSLVPQVPQVSRVPRVSLVLVQPAPSAPRQHHRPQCAVPSAQLEPVRHVRCRHSPASELARS